MECKQTVQTTKHRDASFELLRILAMCMILVLHYLSKGQVLVALDTREGMNGADVAAWIVEAVCLPAVNLYVLISGYFGYRNGSKFSTKKLLRLWGTVLFYSVTMTLILGITGNLVLSGQHVSLMQLSVYDWINVIFPVVTKEYWFMTAYIVLYLLMPFLNAGMEKMEQKDFRNLLICLFVLFSVCKTVLPVSLAMDQKGYDVMWFVCMYLLGGYFGRYGCRLFEQRRRSALLYVISVMATVAGAFAIRYLYLTKGTLSELIRNNYFYTYNHIFCLAASIGCFGIFTKLPIRRERVSAFICKTASCTMAVYLIHEQLYMRYLWPEWFHVQNQAGKWTFVPHMTIVVACIFGGCVVIENVRKRIALSGMKYVQHLQGING